MRLLGKKEIDQKTYASIITEYRTVLYRIAYGYLSSEAKALDAVDEAIYLGYLHRAELREPSFLKTWLTRILINECHRLLRQSKREVAMDESLEETYSSSDVSLPVKLAVETLPEDLKKVIILRYFVGYTIAETAEILSIPEGTVSTRTRKALGLLRIELND